ncbi:hypothetical protein PTSG_03129 [Salpingoeca rosetta]|uniref:DOMON domain-containing protein n=1 Tax=Salpingoeca rosetta (strain ATCC 50818 / BSB-021) TaxID=946362 RepID=F2U4B4_SALR5|nr:uncharacterized protein PTSG_03129 [Salpingoeca rosetta]EGD82480.1 hypothetical protein PTSG_03129 [Salpingoeca rosetta]|eukprot:XP_004995716.1 hypothetical protein PTSG_03129 [Salpingoeca rosetta]
MATAAAGVVVLLVVCAAVGCVGGDGGRVAGSISSGGGGIQLNVSITGTGTHRTLVIDATVTGILEPSSDDAEDVVIANASSLLLFQLSSATSATFFDDDELQRACGPTAFLQARTLGHVDIEAPEWLSEPCAAWVVTSAGPMTATATDATGAGTPAAPPPMRTAAESAATAPARVRAVTVRVPFHTRYCRPHRSGYRFSAAPQVRAAYLLQRQHDTTPTRQTRDTSTDIHWLERLGECLHETKCSTSTCIATSCLHPNGLALVYVTETATTAGSDRGRDQDASGSEGDSQGIRIPVGVPAHADAATMATQLVVWLGVGFVLWHQWGDRLVSFHSRHAKED